MPIIKKNDRTTLHAIEEAVLADADNGFRPHLGASIIGEECQRKLWYTFRWYSERDFPARMLRLFQRGHREEQVFIDLLEKAGVQVMLPAEGQDRVSAFGGHFAGSMDGRVLGLIEAPKTEHVIEFKTHADKYFKQLRKDGVQIAFPKHFAQMQVYMFLLGLTRAYYMAVNKNDDHIHAERIKLNKLYAQELLNKAEGIIFSHSPPMKIAKSATNFQCKWCEHSNSCHYDDMPVKTCRSCEHAWPEANGNWLCFVAGLKEPGHVIPNEVQLTGCPSYRLIGK